MDQAQFEQLLMNLQDADGGVRRPAEEKYDSFRSEYPVETMQALLEVAANGSTEGVTTIALVLLRKLFARDCSFYENADADAQADIRSKLLHIFGNAQNNHHRRNSAACVSALAVKLTGFGGWNELWESLFSTIQDPSAPAEHRASSCDVLQATATVLATTYLKGHLKQLAAGLRSCVMDPSVDVKKSAFDAVHSFVTVIDNKDLPTFRPLMGAMLTGLEQTLNEGDFDGVTRLCSAIAGIVETNPKAASEHTKELLLAMMHVASSPSVEADCRHMAVEVMVSFAEADPKSIKKVPNFTKTIMDLLFEYLLHPEIEDDWDVTFEGEGVSDVEGVSDFDVGATCIDRLSSAIPGKTLQTVAAGLVLDNINSSSWENRHAALTILTYSTEGLAKALLSQLDGIVKSVVPLLHDDNKFVRYAALQTFAQFSSDFAPAFQMNHHEEVLSAIRPLLQDPLPRVQATACAAINNFFDECEAGEDEENFTANMYEPYYHQLSLDLVHLYEGSDFIFVKVNALGALSAIISTGKKNMATYVNDLVPVFQSVLALDDSVNTKDIRELKCKAIECTTILASGVGWDAFEHYAHDVCEFLNSQLALNLPADDQRLRYLLRGWTCMVECMQDRALPYLDVVMPPLLGVANLDCDLEMVDRDVGDEDLSDDETCSYVKICKPGEGEKTMRIKTAEIEEKQTAVTIVYTMTTILKGRLQSFLQPITNCMCEQLTFSALAEIRETAAQTLAEIASSYKEADPSMVPDLVNHVVPQLLEAIRIETEVSVAGEMIIAMYKTINAAEPGTLAEEYVPKLTKILDSILQASVKRRQELITAQANIDPDEEDREDQEEDLEDQEEEETFLLGEVCDAIGSCLRNCPTFLPVFTESFIPTVEGLIDPSMHSMDIRFGLSILDEFCEHAPHGALQHLDVISQAFLHYAGQPDVMTCQPAFYGLFLCIGIVLEHVPQPDESSIAFAKEIFNRCFQFLSAPQASEEEWDETTCNAMSCAVRLIESFGDGEFFNSAKLFQLVVTNLPGKGDEIEAVRLHGRLVYWIVNEHHLVADANVRNTIIGKLRQKKAKETDEEVAMDDETREALSHL